MRIDFFRNSLCLKKLKFFGQKAILASKWNFERSLILSFVFFLLTSFLAHSQNSSFVVVIPSYNNKQWAERNLDSVFSQSYQNFRVIYIDDASTDGTGSVVQEYIQKNHLQERFTYIKNQKRLGALANIYRAVWCCMPHEVVVNLDGDDWLAHRDVLAHLNHVYADPNIWLTYGQFIYYPSYDEGIGCEIPQEVVEQNAFRSFTRGTTALRTFYAGLFHQIKKEDLLDKDDFFSAAYDLAIMFPLLEMARKHVRFIPEVTYVYNISNPINDFKVRIEEQARIDLFLRTKKPYQPLKHYNQKGKPKKIYITPGNWGHLFSENPIFNRDNCLYVLFKLRQFAAEAGYEIHQADSLENLGDFEYLIVFDVLLHQFPDLRRYPKEKLILFLWEPPSVLPEDYNPENHQIFSKVYTWNDELVDNQKYFKFYYPVLNPMIPPVDFSSKKLSSLIACNKESSHPNELYSQRRKVIEFFETLPNNDFDLYGKWWPNSYKTYKGPTERKVDCLKHYKFSFTYENVKNIPGYITEKIFDCFQAGAVPIYWGASNISQYVPKNCFIAREDFQDEESLYAFLKNMSETEYQEYLHNIQAFLTSDAAQLYSIEHFIYIFMNLIRS